jgi:hypothetical protein
MCVDRARLYCDDADVGQVDYSMTVQTDPIGRTRASGFLFGDVAALANRKRLHSASLVSRHFGEMLISIRRISDASAEFEVVQPLAIMAVDPITAPSSVTPDVPTLDDEARAVDDAL